MIAGWVVLALCCAGLVAAAAFFGGKAYLKHKKSQRGGDAMEMDEKARSVIA